MAVGEGDGRDVVVISTRAGVVINTDLDTNVFLPSF